MKLNGPNKCKPSLPKPRAPRVKPEPTFRPRNNRSKPERMAPPMPANANEPPPLNLTLDELGAEQCRYPFGNAAPYLFCGHPTAPGSNYCPYHHRLCRYPPSPPKGRPYRGEQRA